MSNEQLRWLCYAKLPLYKGSGIRVHVCQNKTDIRWMSVLFWRAWRDTVLLRKPYLLISPRLGTELLITHHSATKQFTGLFRLTPRALSGFESLLTKKRQRKKIPTNVNIFFLWRAWRDSNPRPFGS